MAGQHVLYWGREPARITTRVLWLLLLVFLSCEVGRAAAQQPSRLPEEVALDAAAAIQQVYTERSLAILVATKHEPVDVAEYRTAWARTDHLLEALSPGFEALDAEDPEKGAALLLKGIPDFRDFVVVGFLLVDQATRNYQDLVSLLWKVYDDAVAETEDREAATRLTAYRELLMAEGKVLLVRDLVQNAIEERTLHALLLKQLPVLAEEAEGHLQQFGQLMPGPESSALPDDPAVVRAREMRNAALAALAEGKFDVNLPGWWRVQTGAADAIQRVAEPLLATVEARVRAEAAVPAEAEKEEKGGGLGAAGIVLVVLLVLALGGLAYVLVARRSPAVPAPALRRAPAAAPPPDRPAAPEKAPEPEKPPPPEKAAEPEKPPAPPPEPTPTAPPEPRVAEGTRHATPVAHYFAPVLDALRAGGGSGSTRDIIQRIASNPGLSREERDEALAPGSAHSPNPVERACSYLAREGLIEAAPGGVWRLTERGSTAHLSPREAQKLFLKLVKVFAAEQR